MFVCFILTSDEVLSEVRLDLSDSDSMVENSGVCGLNSQPVG